MMRVEQKRVQQWPGGWEEWGRTSLQQCEEKGFQDANEYGSRQTVIVCELSLKQKRILSWLSSSAGLRDGRYNESAQLSSDMRFAYTNSSSMVGKLHRGAVRWMRKMEHHHRYRMWVQTEKVREVDGIGENLAFRCVLLWFPSSFIKYSTILRSSWSGWGWRVSWREAEFCCNASFEA